MKKTAIIPFLFFSLFAFAQNPQVTVKDPDSLKVKMSQLLVRVKIVGNIAYTTTEMHFTNKSKRQMEAELLFPLPEGVSVSRYAIDINGKMREAVPVNKNKGKQVFEAIEHRRVDPGLLEKVEGNNFKTRIYPIMPNGERIVTIGYEQELSGTDKDNLAYQLVSKYSRKLDKFEISIKVLGTGAAPELISDGNESVMEQDGSGSQSYLTSITKTDYMPSEKLTVKIPVHAEIPTVVMQSVKGRHYFYANVFLGNAAIEKPNPATIGLIWDVSLSCKNRNLKKELELLGKYFRKLQNAKVTLYALSYDLERKGAFTISNGDWTALKNTLESITYDGGTRFSQIKLPVYDEYLFFTDGLSSLSINTLGKMAKPLYTVTSSVTADYAFLGYNAMKTGGQFINLNQLNVDMALNKMVRQPLKFIGIKDNFQVAEMYPSTGTAVSGNFSLSGISLKEKNEITLLFGYTDKAVFEKKIILDAGRQANAETDIERLWAQKKIADLNLRYDKNAEEIEMMGRKYGIITANTSLIVLENINDYIAYDIVPPAELRQQFDQMVKQQRESRIAQKSSNWKNIDRYYAQLQAWWGSDIKYAAPPRPKPVKAFQQRRAATRSLNGKVSGTILDSESLPLPGVSVVVKGTATGAQTDFDGKYTIDAKEGDLLEVSYLGYESIVFRVGASGSSAIRLKESSQQLNEVVVTGYRSATKETLLGTATRAKREDIASKPGQALMSEVKGIISSDKSNRDTPIDQEEDGDNAILRNDANGSGRISKTKVQNWNPDRIYLKALEAAPKDKKYLAYMELREDQENNPSFYFDVANYFYNAGDRQKALLILSNIADLGLENHQLYKSLTYVLRQWESYEDALFTAGQVVKWREHEPQNQRDLALAMEDNKQYQAAFDTLIKALEVNYYGEMSGQYAGVEDIILMDINRLMADHSEIKTGKLDKKYSTKIPVDVRIILNWNQMDTDIDLHVVEPTGEECYFGHTSTAAGARFSKDFTQGYGPEQYLLRNAVKGKFIIKTNYFGESALTENGPATVMVEVYTQKNGKTERTLQTIQLGKVRQNENLAEITIL